ncbi:LacI family DNA-binding transcriptional regulator [Nonomuraea basaltis]|uniref:LacI family DNA-binding transcriptional regulator n=1 Tax=Nonomuraea basaltis TaxID=2495887 RepID=UPI00110C5CDB|nr:LacI family DNA-binding transcriptional regulator [Nonomuraea basaltis]TMR97734.1 LacI family transcriptional regulator [Nonomuraea basaltis]
MSTNRRPRVTIDDVARATGVSRQTVSRAINNKTEIDPETRQRILDVARAMGYRPSRFARGLVRQHLTTVGLVIADVLNPFFPEVAAGLLEAAEHRGWQVVVYSTGSDHRKELEVVDMLFDQVDVGVAFLLHQDAIVKAAAANLPFVLLDKGDRAPSVPGVRIDFESGVRQGLEYLIDRGHRRIAMIDDLTYVTAQAPDTRRDLYLKIMTERGLPVDAGWIQPAHNSVEGGGTAMEQLLAAHPDVTAVFAYNDMIAIGAQRRAVQLGLRVPGDCAFLGFDGLSIGELVDPPLTTLHLDKRRLGEIAIEQAALLLAGPGEAAVLDAVIRPELLVRGST